MTPSRSPSLSDVEQRAAGIWESINPAMLLRRRDLGGGQEPDFDILAPAGPVIGALEITQATTPHTRAAAVARKRYFPHGEFALPGLAHDWHLFPTPRTDFRRIAGATPPLLATVEASGRERFFASTDCDPAIQELRRLGIEAGFRWGASSPARAILALPEDHTVWEEHPSDPAPYLTAVVEVHAHKQDNMAKLSAKGPERHLFVWIDPGYYPPWKDMVHGQLPARPPALPREISQVWASTFGPGGVPIAWVATGYDGWQDKSPQPC